MEKTQKLTLHQETLRNLNQIGSRDLQTTFDTCSCPPTTITTTHTVTGAAGRF